MRSDSIAYVPQEQTSQVLWTPIAGTLVAAIEVWKIFLVPGNLWTYILLATFGAALALLGPGAWSVDARLFGWKRIDLPTRKS